MTEGADPPASQHHVVVTFQFGGGLTATVDGVFTFPAGMTRELAYKIVRDDLAEHARTSLRTTGDFVVLFFSLERNALL